MAEATSSGRRHEDSNGAINASEDLVGAPYAVIESDPGVFTTIMQKLGVCGVEAQEVVSLEDGFENNSPFGLIFCFKWQKDANSVEDFKSDVPEQGCPWFANQLSDDSCATLALLNVLLNCDIALGPILESFKDFTKDFSPKMRGLAVANSKELRLVHNSLARPADIRASIAKVTEATLNQPKEQYSKKSPRKGKKVEKLVDEEESYHFVAYVPFQGRVWELDGMKRGPLECSEIENQDDWMDFVRPALRARLAAYSASGEISFNLLALVQDPYQKISDDFELVKREMVYVERRLQQISNDWLSQVSTQLRGTRDLYVGRPSSRLGYGFGVQSNETAVRILKLPEDQLLPTWESCVKRLEPLNRSLEDRARQGASRAKEEQIKRTHDYEPFIQGYITSLYNSGFLFELLDLDENGKKRPTDAKKSKKQD